MVDRPIIFSAAMVRALLDGRKTMTRRLAWRQVDDPDLMRHEIRPSPWQLVRTGAQLWVRETWSLDDNGHEEWPIYRADGCDLPNLPPSRTPARWRPSIHMPRWASRLTLTVTAVRVERLQAISEADAAAEGMCREDDGWSLDGCSTFYAPTAAGTFSHLWNHLHGDDAWDTNPEVVVISFDVRKGNIDV